jgi:drug/metabolite transporter superfamily protein YnfA
MRNFNARFKLRDTDRHIRLLYTLFLLLMTVAFAFSFFWAHSMTSFSPQSIADHYRGSDATYGEPMSFRELAEITHFHLFTMPVVFMILIHVLYLTDTRNGLKAGTTWVAFGGVMLDLASPWLITYVSPIFVLTMLTGDFLMLAGFLVMLVVPLYEMWVLKKPFMAKAQQA